MPATAPSVTPAETPSRTEVLRRIRAALGDPAPPPAATLAAEWDALPRAYRRTSTLTLAEVVELLEDRLRDYDAHVEQVPRAQLSGAIARLLTQRSVRRIVIPPGLSEILAADFSQSLPPDFDFVPDTALSYHQLNAVEGVLTTAQVAIATTGTLVLQNVPGQGRRAATLIPDYHLCLVRLEDIVDTVPEAMDRLADKAALATTFVSGPSATADIEMTRIKGVHGPRFLDVILIA